MSAEALAASGWALVERAFEDDGALRVVPGSHWLGVLGDAVGPAAAEQEHVAGG